MSVDWAHTPKLVPYLYSVTVRKLIFQASVLQCVYFSDCFSFYLYVRDTFSTSGDVVTYKQCNLREVQSTIVELIFDWLNSREFKSVEETGMAVTWKNVTHEGPLSTTYLHICNIFGEARYIWCCWHIMLPRTGFAKS